MDLWFHNASHNVSSVSISINEFFPTCAPLEISILLFIAFSWILYIYVYNKNIRDFFDLNIVPFPSAGFLKGK